MPNFYTSDDLLMRRVHIAIWLCGEAKKIVKQVCYGELVPQKHNIKIQYINASLEAIECYTPITSEDQDGVDNCLTESQLDSFFNNITEITGMCFLPKGSTYRPAALADPEVLGPIGLTGGGTLDLTGGDDTVDQTYPAPKDTDVGP